APNYTMLTDATMRSFEDMAIHLGLIKPGDIKRSTPPYVKLKNGAEVLFRSGDEGDRLRGPNLSGVWLDEASQMDRSVFDIAIGRLREGGEMGQLWATFTPRGRGHWSYQVFGTGAPGVKLIQARTEDNPFLPAQFSQIVRRQYTS